MRGKKFPAIQWLAGGLDVAPLNAESIVTVRRQFALIALSTVALASLVSHATIYMLGVNVEAIRNLEFGRSFHSAPMLAEGSSLPFYGIDWDVVAEKCSRHIIGLTSPGASPCELEYLQDGISNADFTIIGVSISDLNEEVISDFRANMVPLSRTWSDLRESRAAWPLERRTLSEYPLRFVRFLFPTAGRSMGTLVGIRAKLSHLLSLGGGDPLPTMDMSARFPTNKVSDWSAARVLRNADQLREGCQGRHVYAGPKHQALERMVQQADKRGKVLLLVMPLSPPYEQNLMDDSVRRSFEASLGDIARQFPRAKWIRLDRLAQLHSPDLYWDMVHLNKDGETLATAALLKELEPIVRSP